MERVFYLHSPRIVKVEVVKKGDVRRSKLYYLRGKTGKKAKVKEKIGGKRAQRSENTTDLRNANDIDVNTAVHVPETAESASQE